MEPTRPVEGPGLRGTEPTALEDARLTAHYAAQLLAIFGQNFARGANNGNAPQQ